MAVTLSYEADNVRLTIGDDGHGSGQGLGEVNGGYGLIGLRERVQLVGGTVTIHTAPARGFQLDVVILG